MGSNRMIWPLKIPPDLTFWWMSSWKQHYTPCSTQVIWYGTFVSSFTGTFWWHGGSSILRWWFPATALRILHNSHQQRLEMLRMWNDVVVVLQWQTMSTRGRKKYDLMVQADNARWEKEIRRAQLLLGLTEADMSNVTSIGKYASGNLNVESHSIA